MYASKARPSSDRLVYKKPSPPRLQRVRATTTNQRWYLIPSLLASPTLCLLSLIFKPLHCHCANRYPRFCIELSINRHLPLLLTVPDSTHQTQTRFSALPRAAVAQFELHASSTCLPKGNLLPLNALPPPSSISLAAHEAP